MCAGARGAGRERGAVLCMSALWLAVLACLTVVGAEADADAAGEGSGGAVPEPAPGDGAEAEAEEEATPINHFEKVTRETPIVTRRRARSLDQPRQPATSLLGAGNRPTLVHVRERKI